jgi:DNA-binding MarR family transcriptional regulator
VNESLDHYAWDAAHDFAARVTSHALESLRRVDLTLPQARALSLVAQAGQLSGRELAAALAISPSSVVPLCDRLEAQGYLARVRNQVDRRVCWLRVTSAGAAALAELSAVSDAQIRKALATLSSTDRSRLPRILRALTPPLGPSEGPSSIDRSGRQHGG